MPPPVQDLSGQNDRQRGRLLSELLAHQARGEPPPAALASPSTLDDLFACADVAGALQGNIDPVARLITRGVLAPSDSPAYRARFGPYEVIDCVGSGGMGVVLKARDPALDRLVALKILRPELGGDPATLTRFLREARLAASLRHPNIVTIYSVGEIGVPYIAMEYIDGCTLAELIRRRFRLVDDSATEAGEPGPTDDEPGPTQSELAPTRRQPVPPRPRAPGGAPAGLPADLIRTILRGILQGLAAAHERGLIHRDIKSSNILLDGCTAETLAAGADSLGGSLGPVKLGDSVGSVKLRDSLGPVNLAAIELTPKIADFGLARALSSATAVTQAGAILGTPEYMSPEQARGEEVDHRTDLYSTGVVLYEMLTGRTPFRAETPTATLRRLVEEQPPDPRSLSVNTDAPLATLALRLMAKRREERFSSAADAARALEHKSIVRNFPPQILRPTRAFLAASLIGALVLVASLVHFRQPRVIGIRKDETTGRRVEVLYANSREWASVFTFPDEAQMITVTERMELPGGLQRLIVGLRVPIDGCNLFLLDARGQMVSGVALSSTHRWPDCLPPSYWSCRHVIVGNVDGTNGDEIVAIAKDDASFPSMIAVIDPRRGATTATFWHTGHLQASLIVSGFFDKTRPAIICWGENNKLDGFGDPPPRPYDPSPGEDAPATDFRSVPVVLVLDPRAMDGVGPPRRPALLDVFREARPFAYAFLNVSRQQNAGIRQVELPSLIEQHGDSMLAKIHVEDEEGHAAQLAVDRQLRVIDVETHGELPKEHWRNLWKVLDRVP